MKVTCKVTAHAFDTGLTSPCCRPLLRQNDVSSQPKKTLRPRWEPPPPPLVGAPAEGNPPSSAVKSTNHDAGHQMATGSLLIRSCDFVLFYFIIFLDAWCRCVVVVLFL